MGKVKETKVKKIKAKELESLQAIVQLINQTQLKHWRIRSSKNGASWQIKQSKRGA